MENHELYGAFEIQKGNKSIYYILNLSSMFKISSSVIYLFKFLKMETIEKGVKSVQS